MASDTVANGHNGADMAIVTVAQNSQHLTQQANDSTKSIAAFSSQSNFEAAQRMAKALAASSLVPKDYQGNVPNVLLAMELASRIGVSVFAAMQQLFIIQGRPSWSSSFLIACVNSSGRFTPLRFRYVGKDGTDDWGCFAVAKDKSTGDECVGPTITLGMAKAEGWFSKNGSKWKTMSQVMATYRAAAFWTRIYCPEISMGMQTSDEVADVYGAQTLSVGDPTVAAPATKALEAALLAKDAVQNVDPNTGELISGEQLEPGQEA